MKHMENGRTNGREERKNGTDNSGMADGGRMIYDEA